MNKVEYPTGVSANIPIGSLPSGPPPDGKVVSRSAVLTWQEQINIMIRSIWQRGAYIEWYTRIEPEYLIGDMLQIWHVF